MRKMFTGLAVAGLVLAGGVATTGTASAAQPGKTCSFYSTSEPTLRANSSGNAVKALQCELNFSIRNSTRTNLTVDGAFGQDTLGAVYKFQECVGLQVDGVVGPNTWYWLDYYSSGSSWAC